MTSQRELLERNATVLFVGAAVVMALVCGAVIASGWFAGVLEDHAERFFWAGSASGLLMIFVLAAAAFPGGADDKKVVRRVTWLTRGGLLLFVIAPTLCIYGLVADFYRLLT